MQDFTICIILKKIVMDKDMYYWTYWKKREKNDQDTSKNFNE